MKKKNKQVSTFSPPHARYLENFGHSEDSLDISKRIYVLEDIDALDDIVKKRTQDKKKLETTKDVSRENLLADDSEQSEFVPIKYGSAYGESIFLPISF